MKKYLSDKNMTHENDCPLYIPKNEKYANIAILNYVFILYYITISDVNNHYIFSFFIPKLSLSMI